MNYIKLFEENDDQIHWEYPSNFSLAETDERFDRLLANLRETLTYKLKASSGVHIQDASFHAEVDLETKSGSVNIRCSNFAKMISLEDERNLEQKEFVEILRIFKELDYLFIPTNELNKPYTGIEAKAMGIETWGHRFFEYL